MSTLIGHFRALTMNVYILPVCLLLRSSLLVVGCGIGTHIEAGERASRFTNIESEGINYKQLIEKHPNAFQAGCPYPDAYYPDICFEGNFHQVAEDTHWTPFLKASVEYIRETYPRPWSEEAEKLVVFLLGVVQHQIADVSWHSLGIPQGFLSAMGKVNYHGSFSAAHSDGDFGGDVVNWFELDMDYIGTIDKWYVPAEDLLNIYKKLYGTGDRMTMEVVQNCTYLLFLGRLGEGLGVIDLLYPDYAEASPFLVDRMNDYYLGGVDDMAVWSQNTWKHTVTMLDKGTDVCDLPRNPIYIQCNAIDEFSPIRPERYNPGRSRRETSDILKNPGLDSERFRQVVDLVDQDTVFVEETERGVYFSHTRVESSRRTDGGADDPEVVLPAAVYTTDIHYSRLGEAMISGDVNNDGFEDLIIGAPSFGVPGNYQQGRVFIIHGSENGLPITNLTVEEHADEIIDGFALNGRFGASLAVLDINLDGSNDLVVGAPSVGSDTLNYQGEVFVYYGGQFAGFSQPSFRISCRERYCNLGWSLTKGDLNADGHDDLVVGAPFAPAGGEQRGLTGVLYSTRGGHRDITEYDFDWTWNGEQDYEWLGYSISVSNTSNSSNILSAGAPTYRICFRPDCVFDQNDTQSVGKTYHFRSPLPDSPSHMLTGQQTMAQTGSHVSGGTLNGNNVLAVSSTTGSSDLLTQAGLVTLFDSFPLGDPFSTYSGDREFSRFGTKVQLVDVVGSENDDVVISAPYRSATLEDNREEGRVFIFSDEQTRGHHMAEEAALKLGLGEEKARFGSDLATVHARNKVQLAVSAPHSNAKARLSGKIALYDFTR